MSDFQDPGLPGSFGSRLADIDQELVRMAVTCQVRLMDPGIVDRVIRGDDTVCGTPNPLAFDKLRHLLMMHFAVRAKAGDSLGQSQAAQLEGSVIESLQEAFPDLGPPWPPSGK